MRPGDSLWRISSREEVYGNGAEWRRIYESNRGALRDPDRIFPGQELSIPR
ncbi:MAG TPA: LysM peptidoglycan-binding domain-containing protein [Candidatus Omnitrophota bacterium]|nr:LysM peptidoglycan-binding domain-containing protein [Candidatus Omnitrophota bacterium]